MTTERRDASERCVYCAAPATCLGRAEGQETDTYGCDECCGHGNEDGRCVPILAIEVGETGITATIGFTAEYKAKLAAMVPGRAGA